MSRNLAGGGVTFVNADANANISGSFTYAVLVKLISPAGVRTFISQRETGGLNAATLGLSGAVTEVGVSGFTSDGPTLNTTDWYILAATKAGGANVTPRIHIKNLTTDAAWTHTAGNATLDNPNSQVGGVIIVGAAGISALIAADAMWKAALSDLQVETLSINKATNDWLVQTVVPIYCHEWTQQAVTATVIDLVGGVYNSVSQSGTSVSTVEPPGWTYVHPPIPNPNPQTVAITNSHDTSAMAWTATKTQSWLALSPTSGSTPVGGSSTLTVTPTTGALTAGTYNDTITITVLGATNSPRTIPVSFVVQAAGGGPVSLTGTASDSVAMSDVAARTAAAQVRPVADVVAMSDAAVRAPAAPVRAVPDTVALSDAATRAAATRARPVADTVATSDAVARASAASRIAVDTVAVSDAAAGVKVISRAATDTVATSDVAVRAAATRVRPAADTVTTSDTAARAAAAQARTASDTVLASDAVVRGPAVHPRPAVDTVTLSDVAAGVFTAGNVGLSRTASDSVATSDAAVRAPGTRTRPAVDTVTLNDSVLRFSAGARTAGDSLATADVAVRAAAARVRPAADSWTVSDTAAGTVVHVVPTISAAPTSLTFNYKIP